MTLNLTVNEAPASVPATPVSLQVRAFFNETDAGQVSGPFATTQDAQAAAVALLAKSGVLKVKIEPAS